MPKEKKNKKAKVLTYPNRKVEEEVPPEQNEDLSEECLEDKEIIKEIQKVHKMMAGKRTQAETTQGKGKQKPEAKKNKFQKTNKKEEKERSRVLEMEELMKDSDEEEDNGKAAEDSGEDSEQSHGPQEGESEGEENEDEESKEQDSENGEDEADNNSEDNEEESEEKPNEKQERKQEKKGKAEEKKKSEKKEKPVKHKPNKELIVKNLPFTATKKQITKLFIEFGQVTSVKLIGKNNKPSGKALVSFASTEEATKALKANGKEFQGRALKVKKLEVYEEAEGKAKEGKSLDGAKVFIGGMPSGVSEEAIRKFFAECGEVKTAVMTVGKKKSFAVVEFAQVESAKKALQLSGKSLDGKKVKIEMARPEKDKGKSKS